MLIFYFHFPLKIQQATNYKNFLYTRKIKHKSNPQPKNEPLSNLHLAISRQHNPRMTYF